jgi:hypothetical protein
MAFNENYRVTQGAGLQIDVTLADSLGDPVTGYDGTQPLYSFVWPGGSRSVIFTPDTTWIDPAQGVIRITVIEADTATLAPGRYQLLTRLVDAGRTFDAYGCTIDVLAFAGSGVTPLTYTTDNDLHLYGRSWLAGLQDESDETGFVEQQALARQWIERIAQAKRVSGGLAMSVDGRAIAPRVVGGRSQWLKELFDAGALMVTDQVREVCAKYSLHLICAGQIGTGESATAYGNLAQMYLSQAEATVSGMTLELDTDHDGWADLRIDCGQIDPLYG